MTKLHIPHSVQSSPSLLRNKQFLDVSRLKALSGLQERGLPLAEGGNTEHVDNDLAGSDAWKA